MLQQDATILSQKDMDRLMYQINRRKIESEQFRRAEEERLALHEMSLEKVKSWSNTVLVRKSSISRAFFTMNVSY